MKKMSREVKPQQHLRELKKLAGRFPEFLESFEKDHPNWEEAIAVCFLSHSLARLRDLIEDPADSGISWANPHAEFRFEVEFGGTPETGLFPLYGELRSSDLDDDESKVSAVSSILVRAMEIAFLQNLIGEIAVVETDEGFIPLLGQELIKVLSPLDDQSRDTAIREIMRPISFGAGTVEYAEDENGDPIVDESSEDQLQEIQEPLVSVPLTVNGLSMRLITIFELSRPVIDLKTRKGYFPILAGVALQMCEDAPPTDWHEEEWAHLEKWPEEDRDAIWTHLESGWESIFAELGFATKQDFKEVMITLRATIQVASDADLDQAVHEAKSSIARAGNITSITTVIEAGSPELGIDRSKGWKQLLKAVDDASTSAEKGASLERLLSALFNSIPGLEVTNNKRTRTEEIDLWITNSAQDPPLSKEQMLILAECKNWSNKVGKDEFVLFLQKMVNRGPRCSLGFLTSWNGLASTVTEERLRQSQGSHLVALLDREQLVEAVNNGDFLPVVTSAMHRALAI